MRFETKKLNNDRNNALSPILYFIKIYGFYLASLPKYVMKITQPLAP